MKSAEQNERDNSSETHNSSSFLRPLLVALERQLLIPLKQKDVDNLPSDPLAREIVLNRRLWGSYPRNEVVLGAVGAVIVGGVSAVVSTVVRGTPGYEPIGLAALGWVTGQYFAVRYTSDSLDIQ